MVRQSDIKGAYTKVGDPSVKRNSGSSGKIFVIVGFLMVAVLFVSMGRSASSAAQDDNLHSGQAHHSTTGDAPDPAIPGGGGHSSAYDQTPTSPSDSSPLSSESHQPSLSGSSSAFEVHGGVNSSPSDDGGYSPSGPGTTSTSGKSTKSGDDEETSGDDGSDGGDDESSTGEEDDRPKKSSSFGGKPGATTKAGSVGGSTPSSYGSSESGTSSSSTGGGTAGTGSGSSYASGTSEEDDRNPNASEAEKAEVQVANELRAAEETEIVKEEAKVQSKIGKLGSGLRIGLGKLFGDKASTEEIEDMAVAVEQEVTTEVTKEMETEATTVLNQELEDIQEEITAADEEGLTDHEIAEEIQYKREEAIDEMKHSMDEIESRVEKSIATRTSLAEKKVLEDKLSKKLGKTVKLTILEDEDETFGGLNEAIETLPSLRGTDKKKKKKKRTSLGDEAESGSTSRASQPKTDHFGG